MNVVFIPNIDLKNGRNNPYHYSVKSWKHWCDKNDVKLIEWTDPIMDPSKFKITLQRWWVHDILEHNGVDYDQVLMVDADTIVHPDCPNLFELSDNKLVGVHNEGSYDWVLRSLENYSKFAFNGFQSKWWNYIDCGLIMVNETHKPFFKSITDFYWANKDVLKQVESLHVGTDQTPFNILVAAI